MSAQISISPRFGYFIAAFIASYVTLIAVLIFGIRSSIN